MLPASKLSILTKRFFRRALKHLLFLGVSAAGALITGFVLWILTAPFWGWFERATGIESLGREGPDDWVLILLCALSFVCILVVLEWTLGRKPPDQPSSGPSSATSDPRHLL
jgi:H+/Cl- antiporter ClcA